MDNEIVNDNKSYCLILRYLSPIEIYSIFILIWFI